MKASGIAAGALGMALIAAAAGVAAQNYPSKPIRLVLPFPPGAPNDMVGRAIGQKLSQQLGESVVPENHPGAGGNIGLGFAAAQPGDGYTIVLSTPGIAISPSLYSKLTYRQSDLAPVARVSRIANVMVVHPSVPAKTLKQFIALARAHPGKLMFGSGGAGTTNHLANEMLMSLEKIKMVHVPYKGATVGMMAMISGEVDEVVLPVASATPQIRAGKVRALAVLSEQRIPTLPEVPTSKEAGVDDFVVIVWYGMFAPSKTPRDILSRLSAEVVKAIESPEVNKQLTAMGVEPWPGTADEFGALVKSETARYSKLIKSIGLRIN
ncbi:MAG TPA: tripartite tricarboxylate transporter substrate binding protein [Burkholderiales bacterium]|nr:tripartite tricarboxylate transporter substrate binding protein [Burkholderiales bacterium]